MHLEITIKNYRCFSDQYPARFELRKGFIGLVGVNNSGKSSLLKFFYEFRDLFIRIRNSNITKSLSQGEDFALANTVTDTNEVFCSSNNRSLEFQIRFVKLPPPPSSAHPFPVGISLNVPRGSRRFNSILLMDDGPKDLKGQSLHFPENTRLNLDAAPVADLQYIFEVADNLANAIYVGSFRNALNIGGQDYFDMKVGEAFIYDWQRLKTGPENKNSERIHALTKSIKHIFNFDELEISASQDAKTLKVIVNDRSLKLSELGSGLTQFILVLANAAARQPRPSIILLDEPELSLHPSLQIDFMTTLGSYADIGVLFATHSIGLARAIADSIYSVQRTPSGESKIGLYEKTPNLSELLGELSFSGYRELGFDKILLVEGPTETRIIQQFLRLYKQDHQVVLLPLGGGSLINGTATTEHQLNEIKQRISSNVGALIDSERTGAGQVLNRDREDFCQICARIGVACHVLDRLAIENYFPDRAVKAAFSDKYSALGPFTKLKDVSPSWSKADSWKIARNMTEQELRDTGDLGLFIERLCG